MGNSKNNGCAGCLSKDSCEQVYEKLGNAGTLGVAKAIIMAFLLPLVVFTASIVFFERFAAQIGSFGGIVRKVF